MDSATWRHMKNNEEGTGMKMGERFEDNSARRQSEINGQVIETVDLRSFERITPGLQKGAYDVMEVAQYRGASVRLRLPQLIADGLTYATVEVRINKPGTILVLLPGNENDFPVHEAKGVKSLSSIKLAAIFAAKGVELPAQYRVTCDERIGGWVCRKEA